MKCNEQDASHSFSMRQPWAQLGPVSPGHNTRRRAKWALAALEALSKLLRCILSCCKGTHCQAVGSPDGLRAMLFCKTCEMLHSETQGGMERVIKLIPGGQKKKDADSEEDSSEGDTLRSLCKCVCVCVRHAPFKCGSC